MFGLTLKWFFTLPGDDKDTSVSCSEDDSESTSIPSSDGCKVKKKSCYSLLNYVYITLLITDFIEFCLINFWQIIVIDVFWSYIF